MKKTFKTISSLLILIFVAHFAFGQADRHYYQLKIYHLKSDKQVKSVDKYLKEAFVPAVHKLGIKKVGVFNEVEKDTSEQLIYVFIPFQTWDEIATLESRLSKDEEYLNSGKEYLNASYDDPPFQRVETILLKAFRDMPAPEAPDLSAPKNERIYELRSYESPTENYFVNKVKMFNDGDEIGIFSKLNFNAVFYAEVLSGSRMPNLMYMTSFNNMEDRDAHWQAFRDDPAWLKLKALPEYQNNVSKIDIKFLYPAEYSDF